MLWLEVAKIPDLQKLVVLFWEKELNQRKNAAARIPNARIAKNPIARIANDRSARTARNPENPSVKTANANIVVVDARRRDARVAVADVHAHILILIHFRQVKLMIILKLW